MKSIKSPNQIGRNRQTPKESDPYLILMNVSCFLLKPHFLCYTPNSKETHQTPKFSIPPNSFSSENFPLFPPIFWANKQNSSAQYHFFNQLHSPISMEPLNPFFPFPFDPQTGFSIFWCKPLHVLTLKIDQIAQNPSICKQVLLTQLQNTDGFFFFFFFF